MEDTSLIPNKKSRSIWYEPLILVGSTIDVDLCQLWGWQRIHMLDNGVKHMHCQGLDIKVDVKDMEILPLLGMVENKRKLKKDNGASTFILFFSFSFAIIKNRFPVLPSLPV